MKILLMKMEISEWVIQQESQCLLGEISSGGKKSQESNIGDSDNTGDGDTTVGGAIGAGSGGI
ncbi:hypothetical protein Tco_1414410, partial [Tanacetum coccineum]